LSSTLVDVRFQLKGHRRHRKSKADFDSYFHLGFIYHLFHFVIMFPLEQLMMNFIIFLLLIFYPLLNPVFIFERMNDKFYLKNEYFFQLKSITLLHQIN
jgi:hypothetical protein